MNTLNELARKLYAVIDELDDLLLPYTFDLPPIYRDIQDPDFLNHIRRVGVVLYQKTS